MQGLTSQGAIGVGIEDLAEATADRDQVVPLGEGEEKM